MTAGGELGDDRDDDRRDECIDCRCDECQDMRRQNEEFRRPWGPGYVGALGAVSDAALTEEALDRLLSAGGRWPAYRTTLTARRDRAGRRHPLTGPGRGRLACRP